VAAAAGFAVAVSEELLVEGHLVEAGNAVVERGDVGGGIGRVSSLSAKVSATRAADQRRCIFVYPPIGIREIIGLRRGNFGGLNRTASRSEKRNFSGSKEPSDFNEESSHSSCKDKFTRCDDLVVLAGLVRGRFLGSFRLDNSSLIQTYTFHLGTCGAAEQA